MPWSIQRGSPCKRDLPVAAPSVVLCQDDIQLLSLRTIERNSNSQGWNVPLQQRAWPPRRGEGGRVLFLSGDQSRFTRKPCFSKVVDRRYLAGAGGSSSGWLCKLTSDDRRRWWARGAPLHDLPVCKNISWHAWGSRLGLDPKGRKHDYNLYGWIVPGWREARRARFQRIRCRQYRVVDFLWCINQAHTQSSFWRWSRPIWVKVDCDHFWCRWIRRAQDSLLVRW